MKKLNAMFIATLITTSVLAFGGCKKEQRATSGAPTSSTPSASQQTKHAPSGVTPGSHEDWCDEHRVPESMCTRCNPSLIPAFKATGDWCEEHGLPESQCLLCNPNLTIERPPAKRGG